jgi:hypothetical protein
MTVHKILSNGFIVVFGKATIEKVGLNGNRLLFGCLLAAQGIGGGAKRDTARSAVAGAIAEPRKARFCAKRKMRPFI